MLGLKEYFREGLATKIEALEIARQTLSGGQQDSVESIRRIAHALRGSGGTYGFPQVSEAAQRVEEASPSEVGDRVEQLLAMLRGLTRDAGSEGSTVLIVEDDPLDLEIMTKALSSAGRRLIHARTTEQAERALEEEEIHLVLIDLVLPDIDGRNLLLHIRERAATAGTPVFVVSSLVTAQVKAECLALGAQQFIDKPVNPEILSAAVTATLQSASSAAEKWSQDPLTKLQNRAAFHQAFERTSALMMRTGQDLSVGILDLDRFKAINDRHGHAMGDEVLRRSAELISGRLRKSDILARWGGEEFVALFPDTSEQGAVRAMENALATLRTVRFRAAEGEEFIVTFSAGAAAVKLGESIADVLMRADRFLYRAKAAGRRRVFCSTSDISIPQRNILLVEDDELVARVIKSRLTVDPFEVVSCSNAEEALESVRERTVELCILDVNMPGMDGFCLLSEMRKMPSLASVPIVMLTGRGSEQDILRGFELGADDYIVKPFSPMELEARVHRLLKRA